MAYNATMLPVRSDGGLSEWLEANWSTECGDCDNGVMAINCEYRYGSLEGFNSIAFNPNPTQETCYSTGGGEEDRGA